MSRRCRVRQEWFDDWTECSFDGDKAADVMQVMLSRLDSLGYEVEVADEEGEFTSPFEDGGDAS